LGLGRFASLDLAIFVAFHGESLATAGLAVSEDGGVVAIDDVADDAGNACFLEDVGLVVGLVDDHVELGSFVVTHSLIPGTDSEDTRLTSLR
jgi:hypothetical protein